MLRSLGRALGSLLISAVSRVVLGVLYLEGKVLEEMRGAVGLVRLGPRSSINPHADSRCLRPW